MSFLRSALRDHRQRVHAEILGLPAQAGLLRVLDDGGGQVLVRLDGAPRGRADGELEALHVPVPELHGPHDGVRAPERREARPERHHVAVAAHGDGALRAGLHAGVALPAHVRLLVPRLPERLVERHEVGGTDVLAGGPVQGLAPVTLVWIHVSRHRQLSPLAYFTRRWAPPPFRSLPPGCRASRRTSRGWGPAVRGEQSSQFAPAKPALERRPSARPRSSWTTAYFSPRAYLCSLTSTFSSSVA